jgi:hypothetical protein
LANDRSGWVSFDHYLTIHDATLREFEHFIEQDTIAIRNVAFERILLRGRLLCTDGIYLQVSDLFELGEMRRVRMLQYRFHAGIVNLKDRPIFRYDNAHSYEREGQSDPHHKHRFDIATGREIVPPEWIGAANQPTLRTVLTELERWWIEVGQTLPPIGASHRS